MRRSRSSRVPAVQAERSYEIAFSDRAGKEQEIEAVLAGCGLGIRSHLPMKEGQVRRDGWKTVRNCLTSWK